MYAVPVPLVIVTTLQRVRYCHY